MATAGPYSGMSTDEIEERLRQAGLGPAEQQALSDELLLRLRGDLLQGRDADQPDAPAEGRAEPPPSGPRASSRTGRTRGVGPGTAPDAAADRPAWGWGTASPGPARSGRGSPSGAAHAAPAAAEAATAPRVAGAPSVPRPPEAPRSGSAGRFLASLVAAVLVAGGAWGLLQVLDGLDTSPGVEPDGAGRVEPEPDPLPAPPTGEPQPGDVLQPETFLGPAGRVAVEWLVDGVPYSAVIETDGQAGVVDVVYPDPLTGLRIDVRQDLRLERVGSSWSYVGSNPRHPGGAPATSYAPDTFRLQQGADGFYFDQVCDTRSVCADLAFHNLGG